MGRPALELTSFVVRCVDTISEAGKRVHRTLIKIDRFLATARPGFAGLVLLVVGLTGPPSRAAQAQRRAGYQVFIEHCAVCHRVNSGTRAPLPSALRQMSSQQILAALETGMMKSQGAGLTAEERRDVAAFLARRPRAVHPITTGFCPQGSSPLVAGDSGWSGWGAGASNSRFQPANSADLDRAQVERLKLKWAFGFPDFSVAQPAVSRGRVLVGSTSGAVYSLDARTGCIAWTFHASSGVRTAIPVSADGREAYFGDGIANVYAVNTANGRLIWETRVDEHPAARITGAPLLVNRRLYVPVSSGEEGAAINPYYACCTFRGSVVALDATTGKEIWKAYAIPQAPARTGKNAAGVSTWGPSGAAIWSTPTADLSRHAIYAVTGNNYSDPPDTHSDAVLAFDLNSGRMLWSRQMTPRDRWTLACYNPNKANCPPDPGDDLDFGASPILVRLADGNGLILAAQKSGVVYALDPDRKGEIVWQTRLANGGPLGGVEWGGAAGKGRVYYPVSDWKQSVPNAGGGLFALNIATGRVAWHAPPKHADCKERTGCSAAQIAPVTLIAGVVFSGSMDGHLRAYDTGNGEVMWDFNTATGFKTVDGVDAHGGSLNSNGPVLAAGMVYVESGNFQGMPGNVLLAFSPDGR